MPNISTETLVGVGLLGLLAVAYSYTTGSTSPSAAATAVSKAKKKGKKAVSGKSSEKGQSSAETAERSKEGKAGKPDAKKKSKAIAAQRSTESFADVTKHHLEGSAQPPTVEPPVESQAGTDGEAPKSSKKKKGKTGGSEIVADDGKTLAEKLVKRAEPSVVDDMLPAEKPLARVMKVAQPSTKPAPAPALPPSLTTSTSHPSRTSTPVPGFEADYDYDSSPAATPQNKAFPTPSEGKGQSGSKDDDGWEMPKKGGVVAPSSGSGGLAGSYSDTGSGSADSAAGSKGEEQGLGGGWSSVAKGGKSVTTPNRFAALSMPTGPIASRSTSTLTSSSKPKSQVQKQAQQPIEPTKLQKKNAAATEKKKVAKEAEEQDRLQRLAKYRKEQEREKIAQVSSAKKSGGKILGNGMNPSVSQDGRLIWE